MISAIDFQVWMYVSYGRKGADNQKVYPAPSPSQVCF